MAWTAAPLTKLSPKYSFERGDGMTLYCFKIAGTSAAGATGDLTLSTELTSTYGKNESERVMQNIRGSTLYWIDYIASGAPDAPTSASTIAVDNENGLEIFTDDVGTAANSEGFKGNLVTSFPPLIDPILSMSTLGATKKADFYFWFIR
jgi:hypothetical protein